MEFCRFLGYIPTAFRLYFRKVVSHMEQKGVFRSALGGFHKQDVLNYIDGITAEWNEERVQLTEQAEADRELAQQKTQEATEATAALEAAQAAATAAEEENKALAARLEELEAELIDLRRLPEEVRQLTEQLQEVTAQRDVAAAEKAKLTEQLHMETARANTATHEMMAAEERLEQKESELTARNSRISDLERSAAHYREVLGDAEDAGQRVGDIARPYIRQAGQKAGETLQTMQATLDSLLAQLGELQGTITQQQADLQVAMEDADSRMTQAVNAWTGSVKTTADQPAVTDGTVDFFR